jgi:hypothetical protein
MSSRLRILLCKVKEQSERKKKKIEDSMKVEKEERVEDSLELLMGEIVEDSFEKIQEQEYNGEEKYQRILI